MNGTEKLSVYTITLCNLRRRPFRTACLVFLVFLLSFVLFGGSLLAYSAAKGADNMAKRLGADLMVIPRESNQQFEGALLRSEPGTFYFDARWMDKIAGAPGVARVSPQLFVASLNAGCCTVPVQLIGFDPRTDFMVKPWIQTFLPGELRDGEIVVGGLVAARVGETLSFFGRPYRIAARLDRTGLGFDSSVFMNMNTAKNAVRDYVNNGGNFPQENAVSSIAVQLADGYTLRDVAANIYHEIGWEENGMTLVFGERLLATVADGLRTLLVFIGALAGLLWVLAMLVLGVVFSVSLSERRREFGIFRALGASRLRLASLILSESAMVSLVGSLAGIFASGLLVIPFRAYISRVIRMPSVQPVPAMLFLLALASFLVSFAAGPLASIASAIKAGRGETFTAIRVDGL
jgi:putative ABC transport system permease protein